MKNKNDKRIAIMGIASLALATASAKILHTSVKKPEDTEPPVSSGDREGRGLRIEDLAFMETEKTMMEIKNYRSTGVVKIKKSKKYPTYTPPRSMTEEEKAYYAIHKKLPQ